MTPHDDDPDTALPGVPASALFAGRHAALDLLAGCARAAAAGRPQAVLVEGEPRIGKTALVRRAAEALTGFTVVHLAFDKSERHAPYRLVARVLERLGRTGPDDGGDDDGDRADGLEAVGERLLAALTQHARPLAVIIDDLHWVDGPSADALGYVLRRLSDQRVLVVCTLLDPDTDLLRGPELDGSTLTRRRRLATAHEATHELTLTGFDLAEFAELAAGYGRDVVPAALPALHQHTAGHPEYSSMLLADRSLTFTTADSLPVPRAFLDVVRDRLDDVGETSRRLAEGLAVLGGRCPLVLVARVSGLAAPADALGPLLHAGLVRWWPGDPMCPIEPVFPMLGGGIYRLCSPSRRRELHARAATVVVGTDAIWRHRAAAAGLLTMQLTEELEQEVEAALAVGDAARATQYLDWAAELSGIRSDRERLVLTAMVVTPARTADRAVLRDVERWSPGVLRDVVLGLGHWRAGDPARARDLLERALARSTDARPRWLADALRATLAGVAAADADGERAVDLARPVLERRHVRDLRTTVRAARADVLGRLLTSGPDAGIVAVEAFRRRPTAPDAVLPTVRLRLVAESAVCRVLAGQYTAGASEALRVLADSGASSWERRAATAAAVHAWIALGRWAEAAERIETALNGAGAGRWEQVLLTQAAVVAAGTGRFAHAEEWLARLAGQPSTEPGHRLLTAIGRAAVARAHGDGAAIVAAFDRLTDGELTSGPGPALLGWWGPLRVEGLIEVGDLDGAEALLRTVIRSSSPGSTTAWLAGRLAQRAGRREEALRQYRQGVAAPPAADDVVLDRARLELALGRLLGADPSADRWLGAAHRRFADLGAVPFADRAGTVPPDPPPDRDPEIALTGREREVADLVRAGLTNRQTATRLFISEKTVEFHLRNVYAKLGVRTRHELRDGDVPPAGEVTPSGRRTTPQACTGSNPDPGRCTTRRVPPAGRRWPEVG